MTNWWKLEVFSSVNTFMRSWIPGLVFTLISSDWKTPSRRTAAESHGALGMLSSHCMEGLEWKTVCFLSPAVQQGRQTSASRVPPCLLLGVVSGELMGNLKEGNFMKGDLVQDQNRGEVKPVMVEFLVIEALGIDGNVWTNMWQCGLIQGT